MKKMLSLILAVAMIIPMGVIGVAAEAPDLDEKANEVYYSEEFGGTFSRSIEGDVVTVRWIPENSNEDGFTLVNNNGVVTLNGDRFLTLDGFSNVDLSQSDMLSTTSNITWGKWQTFSDRVETGGIPTIVVAGVIAAAAPWLSVKIIASVVAGVASSEYYTVSGKIRYGSDDTYYYYERYTSLQTDTGTYLIKDSFDTGKEPLK